MIVNGSMKLGTILPGVENTSISWTVIFLNSVVCTLFSKNRDSFPLQEKGLPKDFKEKMAELSR